MSRVGSIWAAMVLLVLAATGAMASDARNVLLLHSFGPHFAPFNSFAGHFRAELVRRSTEALDIYEASLETARFAESGSEDPFLAYLLALVAERPPDLVVTLGAPAARFAQAHRAELLPTARMLVTAVEERRIDVAALTDRDAVVAFRLDLPAVVENILSIRPTTNRVFVVLGNSPIEKGWSTEAAHDLAPFEGRVAFEWASPLGFEEILARVATLPTDAAVIYALLAVDGDGVPHEEDRAIAAVRAASAAPLFGLFDSQLGKGIVGGPLLPVDALATEAADIASQLLDGAAPPTLRPSPLSAASIQFDARQLARWGISETQLPPGSRVLFREPTVWELYFWQILVIAAALAIEGGFIVALLINRDRLRRSRAALRTREEEARELSGRLIHAQEDERARLARELHDDVTQRLALLAISAGQGERTAGDNAERAPWTEMREELARLGDDVHALSYRLHPSILADLGLAEALRSECRRFARVEEIAVNMDICDAPEGLPDGTALGLFRIAQEALRNVARHAGASRVKVSLRRVGGRLVLRVSDNGCGFDARQVAPRGLGLASMRQRAALIGGEIDLRSGADGTEIGVSTPIEGERKA